jgi:uncharacterized protein YjlB
MFSTRKWRLLALIAAVALVNALVLPALGQVDEPTIEVTATDNTASEEGLATGAFTLTRTGETTSALDVDYTVTGTATAGNDYVVLSGTATLAIGQATTVVTITPVDDLAVEGDETVILTLVADAAYIIGDDDEATVTIVDNDVLPTIEVAASDATATEAGPTTGAYTLTRTGDLTNTLAVDYTVTGTATSGSDYVALSGTATFAAAASTAIVTVTPVDDALVEGNETVILTLGANAAYTVGVDNQATVTISDNDVLPTVAVTATDATATEEGPTTGAFTVTRTGDVTNTLAVDYTLTGTATSGSDYVALSGTATFAAGAATTVVTLTPVNDAIVEGNETVILTLDADAAYTLGAATQATVTIVDNDVAALPTVAVTATDATATEEGTTTGAFTITRTGDVTGMLTVNYTVSGTATPNTDYLSLTGTVTFAAGAASATLLISPIDDAIVEGNETVILTLGANAAYTLGAATQATVTIVDNDEEDDNGAEDPVLVIPFDKSDCKKGGWEEFGVFKNQGDCVSFVATGGKNLPALLGDMDVEDWLDSLDS